ncbi:MAG TPA: hypothetical protein VG889_18845 [Rhizomicrobium sp.]|nr:hypothetical protein [Rhizomicrobium sp.]
MPIESADTWEELKETVEEQGHTGLVLMSVLRDLVGVGRLGKHVNSQASAELAKVGLGHFPLLVEDWPVNQWAKIRLFVRGGRIERAYAAMTRIAEDAASERKDDAIIASIAKDDSAQIVERIRALVCE